MTLAARRAARAAKTPTTPAAAAAPVQAAAKAPKAPKAVAKKKVASDVKGPMRTIELGRQYKEFIAIVDEKTGMPVPRSYYDGVGRGAKPVAATVDKERVLNASTLVAHINAEVCKPVFGVALRPKILRMLVDGIADQILTLVERGYRVKYPNLAVFTKVQRKARKARNPRTGETVDVPARITLAAKAARSAKTFLGQAAL